MTSTNNDQAYKKLQRHLDRETLGFPATRSGAEIRLLKHVYTPREAEITTCLTHKAESIETIYERARHMVGSQQELVELLDNIEKKGGIGSKKDNGSRVYANIPLVVGIYEHQLNRLTPGFMKDFDAYVNDKKFGVDFISTKLPQLRTIPVTQSITPVHNVSTFDEITALMERAEPPFVVYECICRKKKGLEGTPCQTTERTETCMAVGPIAESTLRHGKGREITREEAIAVLEQNQKDGLVLQPSNTQTAEFFCSCCGCCCGLLSMHKQLPVPVRYWASNFYARVQADQCNGCGKCVKRCQVDAINLSPQNQCAEVNPDRCIGCGNCVPACPRQAVTLQKKAEEVQPPQNIEELYDIIMSNKKGTFGKLKVTGKLILDAIRTGQTHLLK